ncbi:MAG: hypothetical protein OXR66_08525 [Candidatus Woesearchaeota archaeon]|nr:hypothetical protein [Candidatus Woesearchaeota archaeon]
MLLERKFSSVTRGITVLAKETTSPHSSLWYNLARLRKVGLVEQTTLHVTPVGEVLIRRLYDEHSRCQ